MPGPRGVTYVLVACVLGLMLGLPGTAAADRDYLPIFSENHQGDITGTGNTLMSCFDADPQCAAARNGTLNGADNNNNNRAMDWVDVDGDPNTFNSSAATLVLPTGARVLKAVLIYTGRLQQGADVNCPQKPAPAPACLKSKPAPNPDARNTVLFKPPNLGAYETLKADVVDDAFDPNDTRIAREYQGTVDVTTIVAKAGAGEYAVADVQLGTGLNADQAGGWTLAVAYEDTSQPTRNLTLFSGFRFVLADGPPVDFALSGFTTPLSGPVRTTLGLVAIEGDLGTTGDSATINAGAGGNPASVSCPPAVAGDPCKLTNATNPANNFFNASISDRTGHTFTQRRPNFLNQMGFDADVITASNDLRNGQTSTTIRLATSGDGFAPNGMSFATDLFAPSLKVDKTVSPTGAVELGDELTYTVGVTNTGLDAAVNTILTDAIPHGTTYVADSLQVLTGANTGPKTDAARDDQAEFDAATNAVVFRLGDNADATTGGKLAVNGSTQIRFTVRVASSGLPSGFNVINSAGVGFLAETLGTPGHVTSPDVITPVRIPDVTITKTHEPGSFQAGRLARFTLTVRNVGDAPTRGPVTVTDPLPDPLTLVGDPTGSGWDCTATTAREVSCTRSDPLAAGAAYPDITFSARVASGTPAGELVNTARVDANPDGDDSNNTDTDTGPVTRPIIDLAISKTALTPTVFAGDEVLFLLQVTNNGPDTATRVRVQDALPPGLTPISLTPSRGSCAGTTCDLGRMKAGAGAEILVKAVADDNTGGRRLRDRASVSGREDEATLDNNRDSAVVRVRKLVDLVVSKTTATPTVQAGSPVSWDVVVTNNGPSTATQVRLTDALPAPLTLISATPTQGTCSGLTCDLGRLSKGESAQIVVIAASDPSVAGRTLTNVAVADARENELDLANNIATSDVTFTAAPVPPAPDVVVTKTADTQIVNVGGRVTYRMTATNQGQGTAESAIVTDTPDPGLTIVSVTPSQGSCSAGTPITCDVGPLAPGESATVVVVAQATAAGQLRNGVSVLPSTSGGGGSGSRPGAINVADIVAVGPPVVTLRKRADRHVVAPGGRVTFTMTVRARGVRTARDIFVCDRLPQGLAVVRRHGAHLRSGRWCWTIASLPAGHSHQLHLGVRAAATAAGKRRTNFALLTFADRPQQVARARIRVLAAPPNFTG